MLCLFKVMRKNQLGPTSSYLSPMALIGCESSRSLEMKASLKLYLCDQQHLNHSWS